MITYDKAKQIALKDLEGTDVILDSAYETKDAYIFDDEREDVYHTNLVPVVITKKDGRSYGQFVYFNEHNLEWSDKDVKALDYNTGERTGKLICDWDDEE